MLFIHWSQLSTVCLHLSISSRSLPICVFLTILSPTADPKCPTIKVHSHPDFDFHAYLISAKASPSHHCIMHPCSSNGTETERLPTYTLRLLTRLASCATHTQAIRMYQRSQDREDRSCNIEHINSAHTRAPTFLGFRPLPTVGNPNF